MKLVFAGTPEVAIPTLDALFAQHDIASVITRQAAPLGRKRVLTESPVARRAHELGIDVIAANKLGDDVSQAVSELQPDLGVIVAYGGLVREPLLSTPRLGWVNLHFSLLPRWRGAAPVQWSIIGGDDTAGATVFQLVPQLDAGPIFGSVSRPIGAHETAGHLLEALAIDGAALTCRVVDQLAESKIEADDQHGDVTLAPKLTIEDARIDWSADAETVYRRIRGTTPEPGAFTTVEGVRLKVLEAAPARDSARLDSGRLMLDGSRVLVGTSSTPLELLRVQPAGKTAMRAADWWRGIAASAPIRAE
jgi:methionyl-tRNA formyltransferase